MPRGVYNHKCISPNERFWRKVAKLSCGCWMWIGATDSHGYGQIRINGKLVRTHRFSYEAINGVIPEGLELDHLCRNPICVNPSHLEAVTHQTNASRGETGNKTGAAASLKTHCPRGHVYSAENTYLYHGSRNCKECHRIREAQRRATSGTSGVTATTW